jgi:hypothetical protein
VDLLEGLEAGQAVLDHLEDALGGAHQGVCPPVPLLDQRQLALLERLVKLSPAAGQLHRVFLEIGKRALQFLELDGDAIEILVALGG